MAMNSEQIVKDGEVVACAKCGANYRLTARRVTVRDSDRLTCDVCGNEIHRWSEAKVWQAKLIKGAGGEQ